MMGGKVYEVDFLSVKKQTTDAASPTKLASNTLVLDLLSTEKGSGVKLMIPSREQDVIKHALDCLPWTSLSWSIHRGLKDILVAYARPVMDSFRTELADLLKQTVNEQPHLLDRRGWNPQFVRQSMGEMAASAVLASEGNSGDLVRVVTDIVMALVDGWDVAQLDEVTFWRNAAPDRTLDLQWDRGADEGLCARME
ncbi:Uu.00g077170.m01.CDS01 [Anthostomella pinea]|uniref:Uu.00g077170.m01.CDS01 n=1 Tax=Anthostomella pinea TaxID=933095 RepID=A0AAI8YLX0_9PEZI|nr:Uu.00g077170.m01.CDS01 [Anthostomella pinea]